MIDDIRILAVVPARSGSKGIPDKNMQTLEGISLIGLAGRCLSQVSIVDRRIISTDSERYAEEGRRFGLEAPFLRPHELSTDTASAAETVTHALTAVEAIDAVRYDIILIIEPTSPLRLPTDVERTAHHLHESGADSVVAVSPLPAKSHPQKILTVTDGRLDYFMAAGRGVVARQSLPPLYWRNGVCYAVSRRLLLDASAIIGPDSRAEIIDHPVVNIDEPWELEWAAMELSRGSFRFAGAEAAGPSSGR